MNEHTAVERARPARPAPGATGVARGSLGTGTALDESTQELPIELAPPPTTPPPPLSPSESAMAADAPAAAPAAAAHAMAAAPRAAAPADPNPDDGAALPPPEIAPMRRRPFVAPTLPTLSRRSAGLALAGLLLAVGGVAVLSAATKPDADLFGAPPAGESVTVPSTDAPEDDDDAGDGGGGNGGNGGNGNGGGGGGNGGGNGNGNGNGGGRGND